MSEHTLEQTLAGRTIAVPETRELDVFAAMLERRGATVLRCPLVAILDAPDPVPVLDWIGWFASGACDDLILLTGEGLRRLLACIDKNEPALRADFVAQLARVRKITRGPKPARALRELGLKSDIAAETPTTAGIIASLAAERLTDRHVGVQLYGTEPNAPLSHFLHGAGARVALTGTRQAALEEVKAALGSNAHVLVADLADSAAADDLIKRTEETLGGLDILVNNAGLTRDTLLLRMKDEDWDRVLEVNLTAGFRLARAALRGMMKRRFGRIIGITSVVGVAGNAGQANYAASKAGMIGFSKALAQEVASRSITVNCIAPGFIETAMTESLSEEVKSRALAGIPAGRFGQAVEIGAAALYLASDEAAYMTGQTLHVNGGMLMV